MPYKYRKACFGGTFDVPLHRGHETLIRKAFQVSRFCLIGLMSDFYVLGRRKGGVRSFEERKANLMKFLSSEGIGKGRYEIVSLDKFFADEVLDPKQEIEAIIVSEGTMPGARGVNILREDFGLKPLEIVKIKMVMGKDRKRISSTRIRRGEIDRNGKPCRA